MEIMRLINYFFLLTAIVFKEENICLLSVKLYVFERNFINTHKSCIYLIKNTIKNSNIVKKYYNLN